MRVKYNKKGQKLHTELAHDERIKKDFLKHCKELFESEDKVLPDFDKTICYESFSKSLKKNKKHSRGCSSPSWMNILDEPNSPFDLSPPTYKEISKIIHKMKSSGSISLFDHVSELFY